MTYSLLPGATVKYAQHYIDDAPPSWRELRGTIKVIQAGSIPAAIVKWSDGSEYTERLSNLEPAEPIAREPHDNPLEALAANLELGREVAEGPPYNPDDDLPW